MRRLAALVLAAVVAVSTLTGCLPPPPPPPAPILATIDPTGCKPPGLPFGGRWLITYRNLGLYRVVATGYTPTVWTWQLAGSWSSYQLPAVRPWWVEEYPGIRVSVVTNYIPAHNCGVYR